MRSFMYLQPIMVLLVLFPGVAASQTENHSNSPSRPINRDAEEHFERGKQYSREGRLHDALNEFREAMQLDPRDARFLNACGTVHLNWKQMKEARSYFDKAISMDPTYVAPRQNLALVWFAAGHTSKAMDILNEAIKLDPDNPSLLSSLAAFYEWSKQTEKALELYSRAIEIQPDHKTARYNRSRLWLKKHEYEKALIDCSIALKSEPNLGDARVLLGEIYLNQGDYKNAIIVHTQNLTINPDCIVALSQRCEANLYLLRYPESLRDAEKLIALEPEKAYPYASKGAVLAAQGLSASDELWKTCSKALSIDPKCAQAYSNRALYWLARGDLERALVDSNWAISLEPDQPLHFDTRSRIYLEMRRGEDAIRDNRQAVSLAKYKSPYVVRLGKVLDALGNDAEALKCFGDAIEADPEFVEGHRARAQHWFDKREYARSLQDLTSALRLYPKDVELLYLRGLSQENVNSYEPALNDFLLAIQTDPKCIKAMEGRVRILYRTKKLQQALVESEYILQLDPRNTTARDIHNRLAASRDSSQHPVK